MDTNKRIFFTHKTYQKGRSIYFKLHSLPIGVSYLNETNKDCTEFDKEFNETGK